MDQGREGEVYNIGRCDEKTNLEGVKTILRALGKSDSLISFVTDRPGHDLRYAINPYKIETELVWKAIFQFEAGITQTIEWYLNNKQWWENSISDNNEKVNNINKDESERTNSNLFVLFYVYFLISCIELNSQRFNEYLDGGGNMDERDNRDRN